MQFKQLIADDDAVSPVIGVILMVAITVILAAVIGTFVLGIGQNQQTTPSATWDFEFNNQSSGVGDLTITHEGGDTFNNENSNELEVVSDGSTFTGDTLSGEFPISAGYSPSSSPYSVDNGATVRIIWTGPGGDKTQTVGSFNVPN